MRELRSVLSVALVLVLALMLPACILIRTTEHRIKLNDNGSGEAMIRLIDIRSDGRTDSALARDYSIMMASLEKEGIAEFEKGGRKLLSKHFRTSGDTLIAEVTYKFQNLEQIEGMKVKKDELFIVVNEGREIDRTNGSVESWTHDTKRIVWPRDAKRLMYRISEKTIPPTVSLAPLYLKYGLIAPERGQ
jgi:hypothetical protein